MGKAYSHKTAEKDRPAIRKGDNYSTHYSLTELLFSKVDFDFTLPTLEPAAGEGHMTFVLKNYFNRLASYDPVQGIIGFVNGALMASTYDSTYSFLTYNFPQKFSYIITNPPYSIADQFVMRAKEMGSLKFCFLLRINYLSGQTRLKKKIYDGLKWVYVFDRMPDLRAPIRPDGKFPTAMNVYAWFVWEKGYKGTFNGDFIDCSKYAIKAKEMEPEYKQRLIELEIIKPKNKTKELL